MDKSQKEIKCALIKYIEELSNSKKVKRKVFDEWGHSIMECVERKISLLKKNLKCNYISKVLNKGKVKLELEK